jgi:hypothetical protein
VLEDALLGFVGAFSAVAGSAGSAKTAVSQLTEESTP